MHAFFFFFCFSSLHNKHKSRGTLPTDLTLAASPTNSYHYTFQNAPHKFKHEGDHGSQSENTSLFLFGPHRSGWLDISIADRPSRKPVDIMYGHEHGGRTWFHPLPGLEAEHPSSVYHGDRLWVIGKVHIFYINRRESFFFFLTPKEHTSSQGML